MRRLFFAMLLFLHGCATVQPPVPPRPAAQAAADVLQAFSLQGRVSIQYDEQSMSGQITWQANTDSDEVLLSSPLGQGLASISMSPLGATLTRPGEPVLMAENVEELTRKALGFGLPLAGLRYWIQAKADPLSPGDVRSNPGGTVEQITQDGWKIDYLQYSENRPRKIHVTRGGLEIRLVIDAWQAN